MGRQAGRQAEDLPLAVWMRSEDKGSWQWQALALLTCTVLPCLHGLSGARRAGSAAQAQASEGCFVLCLLQHCPSGVRPQKQVNDDANPRASTAPRRRTRSAGAGPAAGAATGRQRRLRASGPDRCVGGGRAGKECSPSQNSFPRTTSSRGLVKQSLSDECIAAYEWKWMDTKHLS